MSYKFLTIVFLPLLINLVYAQDTINEVPKYSFHAIGISVGINQEMEENLLPFIHSGFILNLSYDYRHIKTNYQDIQLILGFSRIAAEPEDVTKSGNIQINTSYSYCFNLVDKPEFKFFLGPQIGASYSYSIFPNWDDSHGYWANYFSLGSNAVVQYNLCDNQRFQCSLSFPLLSLFSRPDLLRLYKFDKASFGGIFESLHSNMKAGFWDSVFALHLSLEYQFPILQTKIEAISYSFDYARVKRSDGNPFHQLIQQIGLKVLL
jgi:hypothetical protein